MSQFIKNIENFKIEKNNGFKPVKYDCILPSLKTHFCKFIDLEQLYFSGLRDKS